MRTNKTYKFPTYIVPHLKNLIKLAEYANSRDGGKWACQSSDPAHNGVYGHAHDTIKTILAELIGAELAQDAIDRINYGGCSSWFADLEAAVEDAFERKRSRDCAVTEES